MMATTSVDTDAGALETKQHASQEVTDAPDSKHVQSGQVQWTFEGEYHAEHVLLPENVGFQTSLKEPLLRDYWSPWKIQPCIGIIGCFGADRA